MLNKAKVIELEEVNKSNQGFNFENELSKVKIPIPLTKLMKIPSFRDPAYRMMKKLYNEIPSDVININDEHPTIFVGSSSPDKI